MAQQIGGDIGKVSSAAYWVKCLFLIPVIIINILFLLLLFSPPATARTAGFYSFFLSVDIPHLSKFDHFYQTKLTLYCADFLDCGLWTFFLVQILVDWQV